MDYFIRCKKLCRLTKYGSNQKVHPLLVRIQIYSNTVSNLLENHLAESTKVEIIPTMESRNSASRHTPNKMHTCKGMF